MECCGKEWKSKITQKCLKHPNQNYFYFCVNQNCLQILCRQCLKIHREAHLNARSNRGEPEICGLAQIETFFYSKAEKEVVYENQKAKPKFIKDIEPCQYLCQMIDQYFYGSTANKVQNEKAYLQSMKVPTATKLIERIERQSQYATSQRFKEKYFQLLDSLLQDTSS